ncbi:MAG: hypothetical protein ACREEB_07965 [Caulobacteraceae bacterium]
MSAIDFPQTSLGARSFAALASSVFHPISDHRGVRLPAPVALHIVRLMKRLQPFLDLLARDIERNPPSLRPLTPTLARRIAAATKGVEVDLDAPIEGKVSLDFRPDRRRR